MPDTSTSTSTSTSTLTATDVLLKAREVLRDTILSAKPKSVIVEVFGQRIELRQPSIKEIIEFQSAAEGRTVISATEMIVQYAFMPGTNQRVFEPGDAEALAEIPFSKDVQRLQQALGGLTDLDMEVKEAEKNSEAAQ
jgi:hypothetical protein